MIALLTAIIPEMDRVIHIPHTGGATASAQLASFGITPTW